MFNRILIKFKEKDARQVFENFISLSFLQGANYILPLITLPYLVRVLESDKYGLIMFAQAFIQYFVVITEYGFNLSATRLISLNRDNNTKISDIFFSVIFIKIFFMILSLFVISAIVFLISRFTADKEIYFLTFGIVIGNVLFPVWFFQGIEKMKYITVLHVLAKAIFTVLIFLFVKKI